MSPCHPFRPVPGQCGPNRRGPLPAPPFDPRDYWATKKFVSSLFESIETKIDKFDVVDPSAEAEAGKAADAKGTYEGLNRVLGVASDARVLAESKADQSALEAHVASTNNPHAVTADQVGAYTKDETNTRLDEKADKATTVAGYGITDAATKEELAAKADIVDGKVPAAQLPSYVDDVLEYDTVSAFPATGESGKIYVAKDTNLVYRWSGTQYVEISPSPAFDNTVTETSQNGVKSSGIWSWVKSLLPHWLTGDYAEPATVASVAEKRDKSDRAVYSVTRTENTDWTWTSDNAELAAALNVGGNVPIWSEIETWELNNEQVDGYQYEYGGSGLRNATDVQFTFSKNGVYFDATATRPRYMDESISPAKQDQQIAAVATDDAAKPADGSLMKYDAASDRFVKATAGTDYADEATGTDRQVVRGRVFDQTKWEISVAESEYAREADHAREAGLVMWSYVEAKPTTLSGYGITDGATKTELAGKRDHGDFAVASGEKTVKFGEWNVTGSDVQPGAVYSLRLTESELTDQWDLLKDGNLIDSAVYDKSVAKSVTEISPADWFNHSQITATRTSLVYVDGPDTLVGAKYVDGKRDLTDNVCRKTEFTEWICNPPRTEFGGVYSVRYDSPVKVYSLFDNEEVVEEIYSPTDDKLNLEFVGYCTATRSAVCTDGKKFVTSDVVDGKVSSAVSTNNPAFVSAVRNTPTENMPEDMPADWGTYGTVGAALAALAAAIRAGVSLGQMTNLGNGRYEYTGALADASTQTYPRDEA